MHSPMHLKAMSAYARATVAITTMLVSFTFSTANAQQPSIALSKGVLVVTDSGGKPVPFATVQLNGGTARVTNLEGRVDLGNKVKDTVRVSLRRIGYIPFDGKLGAVLPGGWFEGTLLAMPQKLTAFKVNAARIQSPLERRGFYDRMLESQRGAYNGEYYTPELLEGRSFAKVSQVLANSRNTRPDNVRGLVVLRGRGGCNMAVLLDGQRINGLFEGRNTSSGSRAKEGLSIDDIVNPGDIAAIEIYPHVGNAPAALQPLTGNASCGVVAIWTGGR